MPSPIGSFWIGGVGDLVGTLDAFTFDNFGLDSILDSQDYVRRGHSFSEHERRKMKKVSWLIVTALLFGCGGGGGGGSSPPADTTAPTVLSTNPANGATGVAVNTAPSASFSEAMDGATINTTTFALAARSTTIPGSVSYSQAGGSATATFTPSADLANDTTYTATITTGLKDLAGNPLAANISWSFTTAAAPQPGPNKAVFVTSVKGNGNLSTWDRCRRKHRACSRGCDMPSEGECGRIDGDVRCLALRRYQ